MTFSKRKREERLAHCDELRDDDGVDPREYFKPTRRRTKTDRKARQLCQQVAEVVSLVLAGDFGDERLHNLCVESVTPAPDSSQLLVVVAPAIAGERLSVVEVRKLLGAVEGHVRAQVAAAITRKRAPRLMFEVLERAADGEDAP